MEITLYGASTRNDGFGTAGRHIFESLKRLGHDITADADIHFTFAQPHQFNTGGRYNVGYFPWESTFPMDDTWIPKMKQMDEVWATSPWVAEQATSWGIESVRVFEHGVDSMFSRRWRMPTEKIRFLFMGLEAARKGGLEAIRAFRRAFPNQDDVELVIKTQDKSLGSPFNNVTFINEDMSREDLVRLYWSCDAFVLPTYGEGFGLPPLEAAATGMPVIVTNGFLPYYDLLDDDLLIDADYIPSPWQDIHPGLMLQPNIDHLVDIYRYVYENYNSVAETAYANSISIPKFYNWDRLTEEAFSALGTRAC